MGRISGALGGVRGEIWKAALTGQLNLSVYCLPDLQVISFPSWVLDQFSISGGLGPVPG